MRGPDVERVDLNEEPLAAENLVDRVAAPTHLCTWGAVNGAISGRQSGPIGSHTRGGNSEPRSRCFWALVFSREIGEFPHVLGRPGGACSLPRSPSCSKTRETARGEEHGTGPDVRLPASDLTAGSGPPRSNDVSGRPQQQFPPQRPGIHVPDPEGQHNSAAAPAQPGSQVTAGQLPGFSRRSGVTPVHDDLGVFRVISCQPWMFCSKRHAVIVVQGVGISCGPHREVVRIWPRPI